MMTQTNKD